MDINKPQPIINVQYVEKYEIQPATPLEVISSLIAILFIALASGILFR